MFFARAWSRLLGAWSRLLDGPVECRARGCVRRADTPAMGKLRTVFQSRTSPSSRTTNASEKPAQRLTSLSHLSHQSPTIHKSKKCTICGSETDVGEERQHTNASEWSLGSVCTGRCNVGLSPATGKHSLGETRKKTHDRWSWFRAWGTGSLLSSLAFGCPGLFISLSSSDVGCWTGRSLSEGPPSV